MKQMLVIVAAVATLAGMACSQQAPAAVAAAPVSGAPLVTVKPTMATNGVPGRLPLATVPSAMHDSTKIRQIIADLMAVNKELQPLEEKIKAGDPTFKTLADRQEAIKKEYAEIEKESQAKLDAKLNADPAAAALVTKRNDLIQQRRVLIDAMRASYPAGMPAAGSMHSGSMVMPRTAPPVGGSAPAAMVPAAPAPVAGKAAESAAP